jgi:hypothetical protein
VRHATIAPHAADLAWSPDAMPIGAYVTASEMMTRFLDTAIPARRMHVDAAYPA